MFDNIEKTKFFAEKYFEFLITDYGFEKVPEYYVSYECHFGYRKGKIEINFCCEADGVSLPFVTLRNFNKTTKINNKEYPEYFYLIEIGMTNEIKKIFESGVLNKADEFELFIKENAEIVKRNPQILSGNLKVFPKTKKKKTLTKSFISIKETDGTVSTYTSEDKKQKGPLDWIKNLFK